MGSDHDVYQEGSFRIPAIYFNDWPDRYIHTNFDSAANIDPTKLKRAAFIGAASGYFLANANAADGAPVFTQTMISTLRRHAAGLQRARGLSDRDIANLTRAEAGYTDAAHRSFLAFIDLNLQATSEPHHYGKFFEFLEFSPMDLLPPIPATGDSLLVFTRNAQPKGPLAVFGYDYFEDHAKAAGIATPKLLNYQGLWGAGEEYAYETLNFVDGQRNAQQIRDAVSAEYGPVPLDMVVEYLKALEKIGVISQRH
jgi:aminopeptidase YwaD